MSSQIKNYRATAEDQKNIKQATENLSVLTNEPPSMSKAIREGVRILAETDPTKPILFYVNRSALRDLEPHLEYCRRHLQLIYDEYLKVAGAPATIEEITGWFGAYSSNFLVANAEAIREGIASKLYYLQRDKYPGLKFGPENVDIPELTELIDACRQLIYAPLIEHKELFFWDCYMVIKDKVELDPMSVERAKNRWRCYANTPEEKARLAEMRRLCDLLDTIKVTDPNMLNIAGFVAYDGAAGVFTPQEYYVKGYGNKPNLLID